MKKKNYLLVAFIVLVNVFALQIIGAPDSTMDEPNNPTVCCPTFYRAGCKYSGNQCVHTGPAPVEPEDN
jgi:hypothetical protein